MADPDAVFGQLAKNSGSDLTFEQRGAWLTQIEILQSSLVGLEGSLFLEFNIPRMGRRIDAVLLIGPVLYVVEFKVGEIRYERAAIEQVWDYALDLKNFHAASHSVRIVPLLVSTEATSSGASDLIVDEDGLFRPILVSNAGFRDAIDIILRQVSGETIDRHRWSQAPYRPTPTILEAARTLYAQHTVEQIARFDAGAKNLRVTSTRIEELVDEARTKQHKVICFVTGVPGAGKTLVGLNVATRRRKVEQPTHAVFLSGNGPLVAVLREALTRDELARQESRGIRARKGKVGESIKAFIQNVHHFRDEALIDTGAPHDHVAIFDEAQRAWNLQETANFMRRKKKRPGFSQSEPEFLIAYMDRHKDWAVIICLVGGGQEINRGEAGIDAWIDAISHGFPEWRMYISSKLTDSEYASGRVTEIVRDRENTYFDDQLHLSVSMRSFRAESVSSFVKALLDCDLQVARKTFSEISERYPIHVTRNLGVAKEWVRTRARGSERFGLVSSSKAQRLKPHAIDVRVDVNPVHWFLNGREDTRSSYYLEDAATEFQVQGLELDWVCMTWDGDLRFTGSGWSFHDFRADRWLNIANANNRQYLRNAYRVLLTRARQGMVVFVPPGDPTDPTRSPAFYDSTFKYLTEIGIPTLDG